MNKLLLVGVLALLLLSFVQAQITCNPTQISATYESGVDVSSQSTSCSNAGNSSVNIAKTGSYFTLSESVIGPSPSQKTINIDFDKDAIEGTHFGTINFDDGSSPIPIFIEVSAKQSQVGEVIVFPTSKIVNVKKGEKKNQNIQVIVPSSYNESITIQSVSFNPDINVVNFGDLDLGQLNPGQTLNIPLVIDALDVELGTYNTEITVLATNSDGQINLPQSKLQITVQSTTNPITDTTFSTQPTCSLSATTLNLNQTYSFTCSNVQSNLEVNVPYNEYLEGVSVDLSSGVYVYNFKPVKHGNTDFISTFSYLGSTIFPAYNEELRITATGSNLAGTDLKFSFTPGLNQVKANQDVLIQLVDNKTGNLADNPEVEIDAVLLNKTGNSFTFMFEPGKEYTMRGKATGYNDLVETIKVESTSVEIILNPLKQFYDVGDSINITTNPVDAKVFLDGSELIGLATLTEGDHKITATHENFLEGEINITAKQNIFVKTTSPLDTEWSKGDKILVELNKESNWSVRVNNTNAGNGFGSIVEFELQEYGPIIIEADGQQVYVKNLEKKSLLGGINWWWIGIGVAAIAVIYIVFIRTNSSEGQGMVFNLGDDQ